MSCIFCDILSGRLPASFVYEDAQVVGIMSLDQPNPYKVLVVPRVHTETVYDLSDEQAASIFRATVKISRAVRDASGCNGLNLVQSNGRAAQQEVFHFHLHIIPRFFGDDIQLSWKPTQADRNNLNQMAKEIRAKLKT